MLPLVLLDLINHVVVWIGSYLMFATAGPAFPEEYKHGDGGSYHGQWRGMRKEGLGVYIYPAPGGSPVGARYEGEWRDNVKDGRGVYYYPKGGTYEGEWSGGTMNGVGVRTFSTGQVRLQSRGLLSGSDFLVCSSKFEVASWFACTGTCLMFP